MINCTNYFSNATQLTLENDFFTTRNLIAPILNRIIPLKQLTELAIECHYMSFITIVKLLSFTPSLRTLKFPGMFLYGNDHIPIQQSKAFQLVSNKYNITDVTLKDCNTLKQLQLVVSLCPRMQCLTITTSMQDLESTIRFLLKKTNQNTCQLISLCFSRPRNNWFEKLDVLIKSETLIDNYMLKLIGGKLYLWW
jgi:hypothetical protein